MPITRGSGPTLAERAVAGSITWSAGSAVINKIVEESREILSHGRRVGRSGPPPADPGKLTAGRGGSCSLCAKRIRMRARSCRSDRKHAPKRKIISGEAAGWPESRHVDTVESYP